MPSSSAVHRLAEQHVQVDVLRVGGHLMHLLGHSLEDRHPLHTQQAVHSCVGQIVLHRTVYHHGAQDNVEVPLDTLLENHVDDNKKNGEKTKDSLTCTVGEVPHTTLD